MNIIPYVKIEFSAGDLRHLTGTNGRAQLAPDWIVHDPRYASLKRRGKIQILGVEPSAALSETEGTGAFDMTAFNKLTEENAKSKIDLGEMDKDLSAIAKGAKKKPVKEAAKARIAALEENGMLDDETVLSSESTTSETESSEAAEAVTSEGSTDEVA